LVRLRDQERDSARRALAAALSRLAAEEQKLAELHRSRAGMLRDVAAAETRLFDAPAEGVLATDELHRRGQHLAFLQYKVREQDLDIAAQEGQVRRAAAEAADARSGLMRAAQALRTLEEHRERWVQEQRREARRREERLLEEVATAACRQRGGRVTHRVDSSKPLERDEARRGGKEPAAGQERPLQGSSTRFDEGARKAGEEKRVFDQLLEAKGRQRQIGRGESVARSTPSVTGGPLVRRESRGDASPLQRLTAERGAVVGDVDAPSRSEESPLMRRRLEGRAGRDAFADEWRHATERQEPRDPAGETAHGTAPPAVVALMAHSARPLSQVGGPAPTSLEPAVAEIARAVLTSVAVHLVGDRTTVHLDLDLGPLGAGSAELVRTEEGVGVSFRFEQAGAQTLIEERLGQLAARLEAAGVPVARLEVVDPGKTPTACAAPLEATPRHGAQASTRSFDNPEHDRRSRGYCVDEEGEPT
jgi:hypothetical protein